MIKDKYEKTLKQFEMYYPTLWERAIDWRPSGGMSVAVKLKDGAVYDYDPMDNSIRQVAVGTEYEDNDELVRKEFGANLQKMIPYTGLSKMEFAEKIGISNVMLCKYIRGNSSPSVVIARKIAKTLGCTIDELFNDGSM